MKSTTAQKKAILIGNVSYQNLPPLDTPQNDIKALGITLRKYGYKVSEYIDVTKEKMPDIVDEFKSFHDSPGEYILYFSGHGFSDQGKNYITSVNSDISCLTYESDSIDRFFVGNNESISIIFIDACRKNKEGVFRELKSRSVLDHSVNSNMIDQYVPDNTIVCFSTSFGYAAGDSYEDSAMSPYAYFLNENLNHFSTDIYSLLNKTRVDVSRETNNKQIPVELLSLKKKFSMYDDMEIPAHINFVQRLVHPSPACGVCKLFPSYLWGSGSVLLGIPPIKPVQSISIPLREQQLIGSVQNFSHIL